MDPRPIGDGVESVPEQVARPLGPIDQRIGLGDEVDDVHPKSVDAAVEPPGHHVVDGAAHLGVLPIEVRLLAREQVQVELARALVPLPGGPREEGSPVGGLGAGLAGLQPRHLAGRPPDVPVTLDGADRAAGVDEPGVLVARVVDDEVHDEPHPAGVQACDERVEVGQRAEDRVDVAVVGDVVAVVVLRGAVDGAEPDDVDSQGVEVVQALGDPGDVPDAVAIGVLEGPGVDLVDDGVAPPVCVHAYVAGAGDEGGVAHGSPRGGPGRSTPVSRRAPSRRWSGGRGSRYRGRGLTSARRARRRR